ncbi:hypothetical protein IWX63_003105 [Arthrobacter sp. CAN_A2]|uniref:hypothetical protein n=1 Tax=Arthrobacter sp. CAN_A2 TaxID=2787718 RepID=UPI0018EFD690
MLSVMENTRDALRDAEVAGAAPFVNYPVTQWWYQPLMAGFFTAMVAGPLLISQGQGAAGFALQVAAIIAVSLFYVAYRAKWGTSPRMRSAPKEVKRAYRWCFVALAGSAVVSVAVWMLLEWQAGLGAIFVTTLTMTWVYERVVYPRAVQQVRERLA